MKGVCALLFKCLFFCIINSIPSVFSSLSSSEGQSNIISTTPAAAIFSTVACDVCNLRSWKCATVRFYCRGLNWTGCTDCELWELIGASAARTVPRSFVALVVPQGLWAGGTGWAVSVLGKPQEADHHSVPDHHPHLPGDHQWPARV